MAVFFGLLASNGKYVATNVFDEMGGFALWAFKDSLEAAETFRFEDSAVGVVKIAGFYDNDYYHLFQSGNYVVGSSAADKADLWYLRDLGNGYTSIERSDDNGNPFGLVVAHTDSSFPPQLLVTNTNITQPSDIPTEGRFQKVPTLLRTC